MDKLAKAKCTVKKIFSDPKIIHLDEDESNEKHSVVVG
jgi:hypothetical protein